MLSNSFLIFAAALPLSVSGAAAVSILRETLRSQQSLLHKPRLNPDQAANIVHDLDKNHDGRIDLAEVASFAVKQGLDAETTEGEFSGMDANHDGVLDIKEVSQALGSLETSPARSHEGALVQSSSSESSQLDGPGANITSIAEQLKQEQVNLMEADALIRQAEDLKAQKRSMLQEATFRANEAATKAAKAETAVLLTSITKLEEEAKTAETQASSLRAKVRADLKEADELMQVANAALRTGSH